MQEQGKNGLDDLGIHAERREKRKGNELIRKVFKKEAKTIAINDFM